MADYSKSGGRSAPGKQPRNKTENEHPKGKLGGAPDKAALLERLKKAAEAKKGAYIRN
ncbi:MAG: hypothetical protein H6900_04135 [Rhodobacter sp.]|uniref:hypothetical protein n=1 Tax=Pararhodobacter sp. TaxID=2127056 RepID=UPI001E08D0CE|nr:hypothetical protein [Pararhodobacter sp.]MCB1346907.1 hypothetical protein [Paracoccaceae bacterium]MCC0072463.1 hypothetical protein [Rhodobacter sp.]HPD91293.1 hypothetical protein [Pararhodobacter sp.]